MSEALLIEKWANIPGHPRYMASNLGRIRNSETKHVLKPRVNKNNNYLEVSLHDKGRKPKHYTIHRLIAKTFLACIDERYFVNHIDSNRHNNKITNLEWCTPSENALHMSKQGRANGGLSRVSYNRYSLQGEFIERYNSTKELEAAGFHCEALREAIKNRKGIYKGFMWNKTRTEVKAVAQYDIKGKLLHIYRGLPQSDGWIIWDKRGKDELRNNFADGEMAWCSFHTPVRIYHQMWMGMIREGESEKRIHPTQKPVRMLGDVLKDFSSEGDIVLDMFGGSGSTLMACEQLNRKCRMIEYEPYYCNAIIARWEKLTGKVAVKQESPNP